MMEEKPRIAERNVPIAEYQHHLKEQIVMDNYKLRLRYRKTDDAKFMSHLDLMATLRRAFIRAGIKLKYSQGFNPHPSISIALPLSVGHSSFCELVDFKTEQYLLPDGIPKIINDVLPEGVEVTEAYIPMRKFDKISWVKIKWELYYDEVVPNITEDLAKRFEMDSIVIEKKSKRTIKEINISPHLKDMCYNDGVPVVMSGLISAREPSINPSNLISALSGEYQRLAPAFVNYTRIEAYDGDMVIFR